MRRTLFFRAGTGGLDPRRRLVSARSTTRPKAWMLVSLEVSPLLAYDTAEHATARSSFMRAALSSQPLIKIPALPRVCRPSRRPSSAGVSVQCDLCFSRGALSRPRPKPTSAGRAPHAAGLDTKSALSLSIFIQPLGRCGSKTVPDNLREKLGIAIAGRTYKAYVDLSPVLAGRPS